METMEDRDNIDAQLFIKTNKPYLDYALSLVSQRLLELSSTKVSLIIYQSLNWLRLPDEELGKDTFSSKI